MFYYLKVAFLVFILQCATRSKVQILALYTKYKNTPCSCEEEINFLFVKCKVETQFRIKHRTDFEEAILDSVSSCLFC